MTIRIYAANTDHLYSCDGAIYMGHRAVETDENYMHLHYHLLSDDCDPYDHENIERSDFWDMATINGKDLYRHHKGLENLYGVDVEIISGLETRLTEDTQRELPSEMCRSFIDNDGNCFYFETLEGYNEFRDEQKEKNRIYIQEYHCGNRPRSILSAESVNFNIGFEIEKNNFMGMKSEGDEIGDYELFAAYETDSSCGVEAITNILPLVNRANRDRVFDLIDDAAVIIDSDYNHECGGHVTISCKNIVPNDLASLIASKFGLFYSLWHKRISNSYVNQSCETAALEYAKKKYGNPSRYSPIVIKPFGVEIRLMNAVKNTRQLKNRYDLMYALADNIQMDFCSFINKARPVVVDMYRSEKKAEKKIQDAYRYQYLIEQNSNSKIFYGE